MRTLRRSLGLLILLAAPCWAESSAPSVAADGNAVLYPHADASAHAAAATSATGWSGGMFGFLVVVLGAAGGWILWQRLRGRSAAPFARGARGDQALAIAETRSLGNRQFLVVASYGEKKYLLGVCPGRIDLLAPLDPASPGFAGAGPGPAFPPRSAP